jgi:hypothetical protein
MAMDLSLKVTKEHADGSADAMVRFDKEMLEVLVQEGVLRILERYIEQEKNAKEGVKLRKKLDRKKQKEFDMDGRC